VLVDKAFSGVLITPGRFRDTLRPLNNFEFVVPSIAVETAKASLSFLPAATLLYFSYAASTVWTNIPFPEFKEILFL
jgi:hypothetical protein